MLLRPMHNRHFLSLLLLIAVVEVCSAATTRLRPSRHAHTEVVLGHSAPRNRRARQQALAGLLALVAVVVAGCTAGTEAPTSSLPQAAAIRTQPLVPTPTPSPTPRPTASPTPSPSPTPAPLTIAEAAKSYAAAAKTYAKAMKAADAGWPAVWCGVRMPSVHDPCDQSSVMKASIRAFKTSLAKEADAISAFIEDFEAIRFPTAALAADNSCRPIISGAVDVDALTLAAEVCSLRAAAVEFRDQIAEASRGKTYPKIEPKWLMAGSIEARAQHHANTLRKALGLPALPKSGWLSQPYRAGRF